MRLTQTTAPIANPVDLASAKLHCRVDHSDDDTFIGSLIDAATQYLDGPHGILGRAIMPQVWLLELPGWQSSLVLPVEPVRSVVVTYIDAQGNDQALDAENYALSAWPSKATELSLNSSLVRPDLADAAYSVQISITAGYADAAAVPDPLKAAIQMLVAHWYQHREAVTASAVTELPMAVNALVAPYRRLI